MSKAFPLAILCLTAALAAPGTARAGIPLLSPVYVQIWSTDTLAHALDGFSRSLAQIYDRNTSAVDEQICRRHKRALAELVSDARKWQANRAKLGRTLDHLQQNPNAGWLALGDFSSAHRTGLHTLSELNGVIEAQRETFHATRPIAALYAALHDAIDGDVSVARRLRAVDWRQAQDDAARPQNAAELLKLDSDFHHAETRLRVAVEHLDEQVSLPCPPVMTPTAQSTPLPAISPGSTVGPGTAVNSSGPSLFRMPGQGPR